MHEPFRLQPLSHAMAHGDTPDPGRRRWLGRTVLACAALAGCARRQGQHREEAAAPAQVAPFSASPPDGRLPRGWEPYALRRDKRVTRYATEAHDGRTVLRAVSDGAATGLRCPVDIDPLQTGRLRFSWKVDKMDPRLTVTDPRIDDSPARVILAFDGDLRRLSLRDLIFFEQVEIFTGRRLPYASLMYVWDGRAALESIHTYSRSGRIRYLVIDSGPRGLGRWQTHERDVVADFRRAFGEEPGPIRSVGVLTDSDDLEVTASALYGDISLGAR
ncbi:MAG: DUF3047 domain-containing protein [Caldimonas sp.]|uniref:DUF3047 domain-containing protein n=1 Tax=Caldimonas sp. TaxID=2838790 RepID=UPI00391B991F